MLRPSYTELMNILNDDEEMDDKITSRYSIVIAVSKRARQIIDGAETYTHVSSDKAVSAAVDEMNEGHIKVFPDVSYMPEKYAYIAAQTVVDKKPEPRLKSLAGTLISNDTDYNLDDTLSEEDEDIVRKPSLTPAFKSPEFEFDDIDEFEDDEEDEDEFTDNNKKSLLSGDFGDMDEPLSKLLPPKLFLDEE